MTSTSRSWPTGWPASWVAKSASRPRIFLKKLVADILDRVDQFDDFDPRQHYSLTISDAELLPVERQAMGASNVDEVELDL